jgi:hypothetical protein
VLNGATILGSAVTGVATGLQFNPLAAAVSCAVAAALVGYKRAPRSRPLWAAGVVLAGWAVGDGIRLAGATASIGYLVAWAIAGIAVGYVLPTLAGAYVGRQVHRGTGWLSAGAIALMVVPAVSVVSGALAGGLMRLVP